MTTTHTAPHTGETHRGTAAACTEYPCRPQREAFAILREDDPRTPAEQAAIDAIDARRWVLWHATDYGTGTVLLLSRAGLLRNAAHEEHLERSAASDRAYRDRCRDADRRAITALDGLAEAAAGLLEGGTDPTQVAAQLRSIAARIQERRERQSSGATPTDVEREEIAA